LDTSRSHSSATTRRGGDPSGRNKTRPPLSGEQIDANARTYFEQVFRILDRDSDRLELLCNGQWLAKLSFAETIKLCAQVTVAQILSREDFAARLSANTPSPCTSFFIRSCKATILS
jgi:tyrosyl-tRNA synthetase